MKYAVLAPVAAGVTARPEWIGEFAEHVEECGFESIVVVEHAVVAATYSSVYPYDSSGKMELGASCDIPDPLDLLAFLAARTSRLGLATGMLVLPNHHPVVLAKRVATIDALSNGRVRLCVGVGWMKEEVEACGAEFASRGRRADEQIDVLRALWSGDTETGVSHHGEFFSFSNAVTRPKPAHRVPIHIGGHSLAAARRAGRRGDGLQPLGVSGEKLATLVDVMRDEAQAVGRDPGALELSLGHLVSAITPEKSEKLAARGVGRIVLRPSPTTDLAAAKKELSECAKRLELSAP
ncbi:LLM class F420-dependent oxidoreductase [Amycolatopsis taiwanensis]|uniref:LLM class F420-dependent oxidoreductase n=1 Tax=Amycolatopsis taiwanensis TaxID=342230 RepID=UPI0004892D9E|nr:LLM class F420-dependent oxidoreductase [Amycolatopsis taiwanensis]